MFTACIAIHCYIIQDMRTYILFTTGLNVPILKKCTFNPNIAQNYQAITLSSIHTKMAEALTLQGADLFDNQVGFRENRSAAFACNLLMI